MKKRFLLLFSIMLMALFSLNLQAKNKGNVAWLGNNLTTDSTYLEVLRAAGYNVVDKTATKGDLTPEQIADLNAYDVVIMSRGSNSADYSATAKYNAITAPVLNLSALVARSNPARWNQFPTDAGAESSKIDVLAAIDMNHPVFTGISLSDTNTVDLMLAGQAFRTLGNAKSAGNGTLIGVTSKDSVVLIAEWAANTAYFPGSVDVPMGKRMVYFTPFGSMLNTAGYKVLTNILEYMITGTVVDPVKRIAWLGNNLTTDSTYIEMLQAAGYAVDDKTATKGDLTPEQIADLNSYDVVVMSRASNSADYTATAKYNAITAPVLNLSALVARSNPVRWNQFPADAGSESSKIDVLAALDMNHPIFTGVSLSDTNTVDLMLAGQAFRTLGGAKSAGNGTLIGVTSKDSVVLIAEWDANTAYFEGSLDVPMGKRMVYFTPFGSMLNTAGYRVLTNILEYMSTGDVVDPEVKGNIAWMGNDIAADTKYLEVLAEAGYNVVNKTATKGDLTTEQIADLNNFDLIVMSRASNSADYTATAKYNSIKTPIVNLSALVARSNPVRWNMVPTDAGSESSKTDVLAVLNTEHPIFTGIKLQENETVDVVLPGQQFRTLGNLKSAGNGSLIGVTAIDSVALIAEWNVNTPYFAGSADSPKGKRMIFFAPFGAQLNETGNNLFVNIAEYMITGEVEDKVIPQKVVTFITENAKADSLYVDLLTKNNMVVNVVTDLLNVTPSDSAMVALEASDVIIFSRNTNSGGYQALTKYNGLKTPIMLMSAYMARNSRWQVFNTGTAVDNDASMLTVKNAAHPIFSGLTIDPLTPLAITTTQKAGATAITNAGNGTVLATSETGNVIIAEWNKKTMFYSGSASVPQGHRMVFYLTGIYDLTPEAEKLYVNTVNYLAAFDVPTVETTTVTLVTEDAVGDKPYVDLLKANNFVVNVVSDLANTTPSDAQLAALEASNVILFSKNVSSGGYQSLANYNRLATPVLLMSNFLARESRWQVLEAEGTVDNDDNTVTVKQTAHPIFEGITLGEGDALGLTMTKKIATVAATAAGNGTVLATSAGSGNVVIAEWARNTKFYSTSTSSAGHRMVFFTNATYDLTADAQELLINTVKYLSDFDYTTYLNNHPNNIMLTNNVIDEGTVVGTVVGELSGTDPDAGANLTYSLVAGEGSIGSDNGLFEITGINLKTKAAFDFEERSSYSINVQVSDGQLTFSKPFVITINNVFETAVKDLQNSGVSVYPNPFADVVYINSKVAGDATISIYTITGQVVYKKLQTLSNKSELKIDLPKGMYIMKIDGDKIQYTTQLIRK